MTQDDPKDVRLPPLAVGPDDRSAGAEVHLCFLAETAGFADEFFAPFLVLGERDIDFVQRTYEEKLAANVEPRLRDLLVAGAGFTRGTPFRPVAPNVATHNVQTQRADPGSILNFYRAMLALRNTRASIARGSSPPSSVGIVRNTGSKTENACSAPR